MEGKRKLENILRWIKIKQYTTVHWIQVKQFFGGKILIINAYTKIKKRSQINNLIFHLDILEKEEQTKCKVSSRKDIIEIREAIRKLKKNNTINQQKRMLVLWKDQQNW